MRGYLPFTWKDRKLRLENQMGLAPFRLGGFRKYGLWFEANLFVCSAELDILWSGSFSHHVRFCSFMFMQQILRSKHPWSFPPDDLSRLWAEMLQKFVKLHVLFFSLLFIHDLICTLVCWYLDIWKFKQRDDGKWRRTEITFDSESVDVLPLEDLSFFHRAVGNEQFGVKIGPVCYRWSNLTRLYVN